MEESSVGDPEKNHEGDWKRLHCLILVAQFTADKL